MKAKIVTNDKVSDAFAVQNWLFLEIGTDVNN